MPQLWVPGSGLVKIPDALAVDQNLSFTATVKGMAEDAALTFLWDAKEEACSVRTPVSRQADVVCAETGSVRSGHSLRSSASSRYSASIRACSGVIAVPSVATEFSNPAACIAMTSI